MSAGVETRLARIGREDAALGSFLRVLPDEARAAARAAGRRAADGAVLGQLDGLPVAVKDNLSIKGQPWTAGCAGWRDRIADRDAHAVSRLRDAGAVILGCTNMEEAALGAVTDNPAFGRCSNPLDRARTPGGSSGGSAAAVAAGFVDLALGTDTLGSVRIPAAYCGVFGLKPTFGLIGRGGLAGLAPSLDTIGPLTRDAALLWPAVIALAGSDPGDPASSPAPMDWTARPHGSDLTGLKVGVPHQCREVDCEDAILAGFDTALKALGDLGAEVVALDLPGWDPHAARRAGLLVIEAEGAAQLADLMTVPDALSPRLRKMLTYGAGLSPETLEQARARCREVSGTIEAAWQSVDALILPTAPQRAFPHDTSAPVNQADLTAPANFSGCPAVSLPVWQRDERLPAAVQLMAPQWSEARLIRWAELLSEALPARRGPA